MCRVAPDHAFSRTRGWGASPWLAPAGAGRWLGLIGEPQPVPAAFGQRLIPEPVKRVACDASWRELFANVQ
jgi:hypothetical protein